MERVNCPFHNDHTASLVKYPDSWYCWGACAKRYTIKQVEEKGILSLNKESHNDPENLSEKFNYIESLPKISYRGLSFPADQGGYFVCWPNREYYKYRFFDPKGPKYIGARGHSVPLFWVRKQGLKTLFLVEGEINALSIGQVFENSDVCSPSSSTKFTENNLTKYLTDLKQYNTIIVLLDLDEAGYKAYIRIRAFFEANNVPFVHYIRLKEDANKILCDYGKNELKIQIENHMPFGLPGENHG